MSNWSSEIKELERFVQSITGQLAELENELSQLVEADKDVVLLLYSRRCMEVIARDICEKESIKISNTIPLKGIIDKLNKEQKVPSNIVTAMLNLNSSSIYGAHPKEFDSGQVRTTLINLASIVKWFISYKGIYTSSEPIPLPPSQPEPLPQKKSIIVLPFENMSADPDQEYFSDGLTEEIITDLSYIHDLLVISRSSAMTFKNSKLTIKEIAKKVNVTHVLEGSVRKAGNRLRITAQLIEASSDTHLWAEKYDGVMDDVFEIQEKVATSITEKLKIRFTKTERKNITDRQFDNPTAFELYIKAKSKVYTWKKDSFEFAVKSFNDALSVEGENSVLYAELGHVYYQYWNFGLRLDINDLERARFYANKAYSLNPESPHALFVSGLLEATGGDIRKAIYFFKSVLKIVPNHENALAFLCLLDSHFNGRLNSTKFMENLEQVNPFHPLLISIKRNFKISQGRMKEAVRIVEQYLDNIEDNFTCAGICYAYMYNQQFGKIKEIIEQISDDLKENNFMKIIIMHNYAIEGEFEKVINLIDENLLLWSRMDFQYSYHIAEVYSLINEKEKSIDWIENSINRGFINYPFFNEYNPFLENIRGEPRFKQLMQRLKHEWENFEV